jgi:hypothetical protein
MSSGMETDYRKALCILIDEGFVTTDQVKQAVSKAKKLQYKEGQDSATWKSAHTLAVELRELCVANGYKAFSINKSSMSDIEYLLRVTNHTEEEVRGVIEWATSDTFWSPVILNTTQLRKHFDQLFIRRNRTSVQQPVVDRSEEVRKSMENFEKKLEQRRAEAVPMPRGFKDVLKKGKSSEVE